jgi:hypothetical protein
MIKNREIAQNISELMLDFAERLNKSLYLIKEKCSEEEFKIYRRGVGYILGNISTEVLNELYKEHPHLKPKEYYLPGVSNTGGN